MKREQTECSEMSVYKTQTPENHPKERIQFVFYFCGLCQPFHLDSMLSTFTTWNFSFFFNSSENRHKLAQRIMLYQSPEPTVFCAASSVSNKAPTALSALQSPPMCNGLTGPLSRGN